ncbi:hypothetical protein SAMN02799642_03168 [Methylobacterium brachiatum]|nr:hypothetical protein SAMN02799642_03168 [Methylobacterium brachiatum]
MTQSVLPDTQLMVLKAVDPAYRRDWHKIKILMRTSHWPNIKDQIIGLTFSVFPLNMTVVGRRVSLGCGYL